MQSTRYDSTGTVDTCCQGLYFIHTTRQIQYNDILNSSIHDSTYVENNDYGDDDADDDTDDDTDNDDIQSTTSSQLNFTDIHKCNDNHHD